MKMNEKIEIVLSRKRIRKTDFAHSIGVTYRAFANYLNGSRTPRASTLKKIADELQLTPDFLKDDSQELELTIEERFLRKVSASDSEKMQAAQFLAAVPWVVRRQLPQRGGQGGPLPLPVGYLRGFQEKDRRLMNIIRQTAARVRRECRRAGHIRDR